MISGSVIIVSYNSSEFIAACLMALARDKHWKLILVDNASTDSTVEIAKSIAPEVCLIRNDENRGFAAAANQGFQVSDGGICVLLNPDAIPQPGSLDNLARALTVESIGAAGGALMDAEGRIEKGFTVRRLPTLPAFLAEVLLVNRLWPGNLVNRRYRCLDLDYAKAQEVEQPAGACLAVKREVWQQIGGFDEHFRPAWFEDVDFCRRLRDHGWKIVFCPDARFFHAGGHSVSQLSFAERQTFWYGNLLHYFSKHHAQWQVLVLRAGVACGLLLRCLLSLVGLGPAGVSTRESISTYWNVAWDYAVLGKELPRNPGPNVVASPAT